MTTLRDAVDAARRRLAAAGIDSPGREARLLLARILGWTEAGLLARDEETLPPEAAARFAVLLERRLRREPVAFLLGERDFHGRAFSVDRRVLVPRPETEHLVERALALPLAPDARVVDVGTGSGAIAVTLASERPGWRIAATDVSLAALAVARANVRRHDVSDRVGLLAGDLLAPLELGRIALVVANPPYIADAEAVFLPADVVAFEPARALFAGPSGLEVITALLEGAEGLRPGAFLVFEIGAGQADAVAREVERRRAFDLLGIAPDFAGIPRVVVLRRRG